MQQNKTYKILLSGGGTGGHIFPAIAIANELKSRLQNAEFLFIGALDKMEMEKVPNAGYHIEGLPIRGLSRSLNMDLFKFPFRLIKSLKRANQIIKDFAPDIVIGTGGYASGPTGFMAQRNRIKTVIQEQNSFPGITNKRLGKKANRIFVAYDQMEKYFPKEAIRVTGNPVRKGLFSDELNQKEAKLTLGFDENKPLLFSIGGSLGSRTLNQVWIERAKQLVESGYQLLWQTGSTDFEQVSSDFQEMGGVQIRQFIQEMNVAYAATDIIVSRAGAIAISELCIVGKPVILVPYPYAAEDHQTKNAQSLAQEHAAIVIADKDAESLLYNQAVELLNNAPLQQKMSRNIQKFARPHATEHIVDQIIQLLENEE